MTGDIAIGTLVLIDPTPGPVNLECLKTGTFKGHIPHADFGLVPWLMTHEGTGLLGYECWWSKAARAESNLETFLKDVIGHDPTIKAH